MDNHEIIWQPSSESKKLSNLSRFIEFANQRYSQSIKTEYHDIWDWSVNNIKMVANAKINAIAVTYGYNVKKNERKRVRTV